MPMSNAAIDRMMDFDLSEEQRLVRKTVREFAEAEILPYVEEYEREERYPTELVDKLPDLGLMGPMIPEEYGGSFSDVLSYGVICEELARVDWVVASVVSVANSLWSPGSLRQFGTDEQKQALPARDRGRRHHLLRLPDRAAGRHRPRQHGDDGQEGRRRLPAERDEGLHLPRRAREPLLHRRVDRPRTEAQGRHGVRRRPARAEGASRSATSRCGR